MNDTLVLGFGQAREFARMHGTPLLCLSRERLRDNYRRLRRALPGVEIFYAVKANPHPMVLTTLAEEGARSDVATLSELRVLESVGVSSAKALYTHPIKKPQGIREAVRLGIETMVVDNVYEIEKIAKAAPGAKIMIRLSESNMDAMVNLSYKFGVDVDGAFEIARLGTKLGLEIKGLCFHVGSQNVNPTHFVDGLIRACLVIEELKREGIFITTLDIGGGFPIEYTSPVLPIEEFCAPIRSAIKQNCDGLRVITEPGRYLVGDTITLLTSVIGKAERNDVIWYYVDDGIYNSFSGKVFESCNYQVCADRDGPLVDAVVAGPTCDSHDVVFSDCLLPELDIDDLTVIPCMGAYTSCSATEFNGYERAKIIAID